MFKIKRNLSPSEKLQNRIDKEIDDHVAVAYNVRREPGEDRDQFLSRATGLSPELAHRMMTKAINRQMEEIGRGYPKLIA